MTMVFSFFILALSSAFAVPHLDLEMTSAEYRRYLKNHHSPLKDLDDPRISYAIQLGERLGRWISLVNSKRTPENALRLTLPSLRRSYPIDKPNVYSAAIIKTDTDQILASLPEAMKSVLLSSAELPETIPVDDETFLFHARLLDRNYQSAARYKSLNPYRDDYTQMAAADVRGYYYLTKNKVTGDDLKDVALIPAEKVAPLKEALGKICINAAGEDTLSCAAKVEEAFKSNALVSYYDLYFPIARDNWNSFFQIPAYGKRHDVLWSDAVMTVPFLTPTVAKFGPYLKDNIEDEYHFGNWKLNLNFGNNENGPHLVFQRGVVPHVNQLGGNEIVMDENQPIEEYESQWTIRHEFGHVLGFPDCYHEFFDVNLDAYVNYQLDTTDLMCSRAGNMKERMYLELKRTYAP